MPTNQIGSLLFVTVGRPPVEQGQQVQEITRPGVDGVAYRRTAKRSEPYRLTAQRDFETSAAFESYLASAIGLRGYPVTWYDGHGDAHENTLITKVRTLQKKKIAGAAGGFHGATATVWGAIEFECADVSTP